jgi:hypothetical protein
MRILWLFKRWQPLYDELARDPRVEFYQGIPDNLEYDSFLNTNVRNLIVVDGMMSTANKDPRINELFIGSHHRNLSVIALNQNLYFSRDPTQRRNCHYLILFNTPIDKTAVRTLARQMYPGNTVKLMQKYEEAIRVPYGYLLIDVKPFTTDSQRMRPNALSIDKTSQQ